MIFAIKATGSDNLINHKLKWPPLRNPQKLPQPKLLLPRRLSPTRRDVVRPSQSTSTVSSSRFTPRLVSPRSQCQSWTPSSTTSSRRLPLNPPALFATTRSTLSHPERFKPLSDFFFPESSPNTPSLKVPRLSPNTPAHDLCSDLNYISLFNRPKLNLFFVHFFIFHHSSILKSMLLCVWTNFWLFL